MLKKKEKENGKNNFFKQLQAALDERKRNKTKQPSLIKHCVEVLILTGQQLIRTQVAFIISLGY